MSNALCVEWDLVCRVEPWKILLCRCIVSVVGATLSTDVRKVIFCSFSKFKHQAFEIYLQLHIQWTNWCFGGSWFDVILILKSYEMFLFYFLLWNSSVLIQCHQFCVIRKSSASQNGLFSLKTCTQCRPPIWKLPKFTNDINQNICCTSTVWCQQVFNLWSEWPVSLSLFFSFIFSFPFMPSFFIPFNSSSPFSLSSASPRILFLAVEIFELFKYQLHSSLPPPPFQYFDCVPVWNSLLFWWFH